jgi:hypothetical protein
MFFSRSFSFIPETFPWEKNSANSRRAFASHNMTSYRCSSWTKKNRKKNEKVIVLSLDMYSKLATRKKEKKEKEQHKLMLSFFPSRKQFCSCYRRLHLFNIILWWILFLYKFSKEFSCFTSISNGYIIKCFPTNQDQVFVKNKLNSDSWAFIN